MTKSALSRTRWRESEGFDFPFPRGFDFGVAVAFADQGSLFQSVDGNGPTSHVFDPVTAGP